MVYVYVCLTEILYKFLTIYIYIYAFSGMISTILYVIKPIRLININSLVSEFSPSSPSAYAIIIHFCGNGFK